MIWHSLDQGLWVVHFAPGNEGVCSNDYDFVCMQTFVNTVGVLCSTGYSGGFNHTVEGFQPLLW